MLTLDIICDDESWGDVDVLVGLIGIWAEAAARRASEELGEDGAVEASLKLSHDEEVRELNLRFRGIDKPTNVLSFPSGDEFPAPDDRPIPLGDIIIARETTAREAAEQDKPFDHHLAHLVVHGVLHLYGFDHDEEDEAEEMEQIEREILAGLDIPSPYDETL